MQFHALTFIMVPLDIETLDVPTKRSYFNWMIGKAICNSDPNSTKLCHKNHGHPLWQTRKASVVKQTRPWHKQLCKSIVKDWIWEKIASKEDAGKWFAMNILWG